MSKTADRPSVVRGFVLALLLLALSGGQALAHRSPSNCNANRLTFALDRNSGDIVNGQTVTYAVGVFNPGPGIGIGCDVTGLTVTFTCPGPDGTPSGPTTVLGTSLSFPADNSSDTIFPLVSCKIVVNPGVTSATARGQVGQNTGNRTADLLKGVVHDSAIDDPFVQINDLTVSVNITCAAKVDKQVSCDGGKTFHDVGLVTADEDGHTDVCFGWNAFTIGSTSMPAEPIQVRYAVANAGTAELFTCSITEGNAGFPITVSVGSLAGACVADVDCGNAQATCVNGACVFTSGVNSAACSATLAAAEPDTATVTCDCTPTPGEVQATAFDEANFQCQTTGLTVTKECALRDTNSNSAVAITVTNTGTADLANCVVTDTNFTDAGCPASGTPSGASSAVAVTPSTIASLAAGVTGQYVAQNTGGTALFSCTVTDSNTAISSTAVPIADTIAVGGTASPVPVNKTCSDTLDASEPDTATLSCFCTADLNPNFKATAKDSASFDCQTPGLVVTKDCGLRDTSGNNAVTITVNNTGTADLENCTVTDTNFTDAACPASGTPSGTSSAVAVSPSTIASLGHESMTTVTGTVAGLTKDSCNTVSVTCEIKGSVDPNNSGHQKTLTATAQDTCETCSVQIDKQIKCGAGPFIDVGFVSNNEDGTASCLGWNAFTIDGANVPAESLTVQYTAKNTGGTALFSCTVTDTNTVISSTTVPIADTIVVSGTSNPVPINTTCSAELSASEPDTATVSCFCTADKNANFLATAKDMAKFQCLTPGLNVTKTCLVPDASGNSEVDIELMNTGTADLANCVVSDNVFKNDPTCPPTGASTPVTVPGVASLPHGMSTTVKGSVSGITTNACNTAAVTCEVVGSVDPANPSQQKKITATDSAVCEVPSVKIEKVCVAQDANGVNQMTFKVTNTGGVALANCAIADNIFTNDPTCPPTGAGTPVPTTPATIASLDPGAMASATGSVSGLTGNACDEVSVTCDVVGATGRTVTANDAQVCLAAPPPSGCRVTGGGLVYACGSTLPGSDAPQHCGDRASDAQDATHGGQVGAPVGVATAFTPDSVCIQGEWQHVRHIKPKLNGNFHARTFDSLNCACLPCAGDPGSGTVTDGLCNPGDRICGPEPRRAPDNAICFSGVGDYAVTNGNRPPPSLVVRA